MRDLAAEILSSHGYVVLSAENGRQALKILETEAIDLLLTDVIMPGMDGYQLVSKVRQEHPGIKIIIASGYNSEKEKPDMFNYKQLEKPYRTNVLLQAIGELLDE